MLSQFPAFRLTVAHQMAGYRERIAKRIVREAGNHGESPTDLASALDVHASTVERWFRAERTPQPRLRRKLAAHWGIPPGEFEPDPEAEARELQDQLNRIERGINRLLEAHGLEPETEEEVTAGLAAWARLVEQPEDEDAQKPGQESV